MRHAAVVLVVTPLAAGPLGCGGGDSPAASGSGGAPSASSASSAASSSTSSSAGAGGAGGAGGAPSAPSFGAPAPLSDPTSQAFVPVLAVHGGSTLVAWHEFPMGASSSQVMISIVTGGEPGPATPLADPFAGPKNPWVAPTSSGFVVAYQANDGQTDVVRAVEIDDAGVVTRGPDTISTPGSEAAMPRVAAAGAEEAFSWTDGQKHSFAMRGPLETVPGSDVGTTLLSQGILNFPRIALHEDGSLDLAYRDGGSDTTDWDVLLVVRPPGAAFGAPADVSKSPGLLSDDIALALEQDGTLDLAWVDQDGSNVDAFEVDWATRSPAGSISSAHRYGTQGLWAWAPSVVPGGASVWTTSTGAKGPFWFGAAGLPPTSILSGSQGSHPSLARDAQGAFHLAYADDAAPARIRYVESAP
ncbi:MAG TPA: hypothetical protein VHB21_11590 [Minicystis sp.]|nr:hypothetical protein [Minicystis sp.]